MMTLEDIQGIDTHGFKCEFNDGGELVINLPFVYMYIRKENSYCDRGRYGFISEVKEGFHHELTIDSADCFPRYFFSLQRAFDEMADWVDCRKKGIGLEKKEE